MRRRHLLTTTSAALFGPLVAGCTKCGDPFPETSLALTDIGLTAASSTWTLGGVVVNELFNQPSSVDPFENVELLVFDRTGTERERVAVGTPAEGSGFELQRHTDEQGCVGEDRWRVYRKPVRVTTAYLPAFLSFAVGGSCVDPILSSYTYTGDARTTTDTAATTSTAGTTTPRAAYDVTRHETCDPPAPPFGSETETTE